MADVEVVHPCRLAAADLDAWRAMQVQTPALASPLLGPGFVCAVGEVRADARVAVWRQGGRPRAFLAHHRRPGGFGRPIGAPFSDYHALVSEPGFELEGAQALADAQLSALRLCGLVDPFGRFASAVRTRDPAYRIVLEGSGRDYLDRLAGESANRAKNHRRYLRKLERDLGPVRLEPRDLDQAAFERLLAWKRAQLERGGLHDFLRPDWTRALLQRLFDTREGDFQGLMINLYAGDRLLAGHFGVRQGDWHHPWIGAMDPELEAYGPGFVHQWAAIEAMPALGLRTYDLGAGSGHWKRMFTTTALEVGCGLATASGLGGRLAGASEQVWDVSAIGRTTVGRRMRNRLDQIATMELTLGGRLRGVVDAVAGLERRAASRPAAAATAR